MRNSIRQKYGYTMQKYLINSNNKQPHILNPLLIFLEIDCNAHRGSNDVLMGDCVRHKDVMLSNFGWSFEHEKWFFLFESPFYMQQLKNIPDELNLEVSFLVKFKER